MKRLIKCYFSSLLLLLPSFNFAQVGNPAPDFTVTDINGNTHRLYDDVEAGKVVVLDFYYTTCGPCQFYSPQVNLAYEKYGCNTSNVVFLSIDYNDTDAEVLAYDNEYAIEFPSISGLEGGGNQVVSDYQIIGFPTFYVIDSSKTILDVIDPPTLQVFDFRFAMHGILPASCVTSLEEAGHVDEQLNLFPNPLGKNDKLHFILPEKFLGKNQYEIFDFTGHFIKTGVINSNDDNLCEVEIKGLLPGIYFLTARQASTNLIYSKSFLIK